MSDLNEIMRDAVEAAFRDDPWLACGGVFPPQALIARVASEAVAVARAYEAGEYNE